MSSEAGQIIIIISNELD